MKSLQLRNQMALFYFPYKHNHTLSWSKEVSGGCLPWVEHLEFTATQVKALLVGFCRLARCFTLRVQGRSQT